METSVMQDQPTKPAPKDLHFFLKASNKMNFTARVNAFTTFIEALKKEGGYTYCRLIVSPPGREVTIWDPVPGKERRMLMFASNNYLGLANDPYVKQQVLEAIDKYGTGLAGPPLLNGFTKLMQELEARLAQLKHQEAALIFPSGYMANLGIFTALVREHDTVLYDQLSHASFYDAMHLVDASYIPFAHNNLAEMETMMENRPNAKNGTVFVGIEGVYSMDGDLAPLDQLIPIVKKHGAISILDDAHGTGVLGKTGSGTAEHFGVEHQIDLSMGTFSKTFAVTGGFVAGSKDVVNYMRFFARPYMFSAALPPTTLAAVLAGIDIIENEPWRRENLLENARYLTEKLQPFGIISKPEAAIVALQVPQWMDLRKANYYIHERGIFLNAIEYPAVQEDKQRFRISLMAEHTKADIDRLVETLEETWRHPAVRKEGSKP